MNGCDISLILPSRGRFDNLKRMIESCFNMASNPSAIELIVRIDFDDAASTARLNELAGFKNVKAIMGWRANGYPSIHTFINECAALSTGLWISSLNDDCWFESRNWDVALLDAANKLKCGRHDFKVLYATIDRPIDKESEDYKRFAERPRLDFPIISRPLYESVGVYSPTPAWDWFWNDAVQKHPSLTGSVIPGMLIQHAYQRGEVYPDYQYEPKVEYHKSDECQKAIALCMEKLK